MFNHHNHNSVKSLSLGGLGQEILDPCGHLATLDGASVRKANDLTLLLKARLVVFGTLEVDPEDRKTCARFITGLNLMRADIRSPAGQVVSSEALLAHAERVERAKGQLPEMDAIIQELLELGYTITCALIDEEVGGDELAGSNRVAVLSICKEE